MTDLSDALKAAGIGNAVERLKDLAASVATMTPDQWRDYAGSITNTEQDRIQRRLMQVAREAIQQSPRNWDGAKDAFYAKVRKDADLLWEMLGPYRAQASQFWLTQAAAAIRQEEKPRLVEARRSEAGHGYHDNRCGNARVAPVAGGLQRHEDHILAAPSKPSAAAGMAAVSAVTRLSLLDTFKINGQPVGDLTPEEANKWAGSRERDARFVRMLTQNLPHNQPIKKFRTSDEAAQMMALAETADA